MATRLNAERLRAAAAAHGDTTDMQIAAKTQVSGSTISRLAKPGSTQKASVETFRALGRPYGLTVDDLILDDEEAGDTEADPERVAA